MLPRAVPVRQAEPTEAVPFGNLGLIPELREALTATGIQEATEVQALAFPSIRERKDVLVASHTGSGKTLAYFLPIVQELRRQEDEQGFVGRPKRPRVLVVAPTRELTQQIGGVAKQLAAHARSRVTVLTGAARSSQARKRPLIGPVDIAVGTTSTALAAAKEGHITLGDVQYLVVDEADTMFDQGFGPEVVKLLDALKARGGGAKLATVLVSATLSGTLKKLAKKEFPGMVSAETTTLHKGIAGSRHTFVPMEAGASRLDALTQILADASGTRAMVFCNSVKACRAADHHLVEAGFATVCFHGEMPAPARASTIAEFTDSAVAGTARQPVLVCTDLAARGLDMPARVDHVVNFDMPSNPVWYLHRSGRTARAGAAGSVTSLMQSAMDRTLGRRIENALKHNEPLDQLSAVKRDPALHNKGQGGKPPPEKPKQKGNNHQAWRSQQARQERRESARGRGGAAGGRGAGTTRPAHHDTYQPHGTRLQRAVARKRRGLYQPTGGRSRRRTGTRAYSSGAAEGLPTDAHHAWSSGVLR